MTLDADTLAESPPAAASIGAKNPILWQARLFYWSVRRELWEHRAIYIAPLAVAVLGLLGFLFGVSRLPQYAEKGVRLAHLNTARAG